jgi:hypothetical protein
MFTAVFNAVPRLPMDDEVASTSKMGQPGQIADTMSRSREISPAQPVFVAGNGPVWPFWLTFWKQPLAGGPKVDR